MSNEVKDYHSKAMPNEPRFVILARDPIAPVLVRLWASVAELTGTQPIEKVENALVIAEEMERWRLENSDQVTGSGESNEGGS